MGTRGGDAVIEPRPVLTRGSGHDPVLGKRQEVVRAEPRDERPLARGRVGQVDVQDLAPLGPDGEADAERGRQARPWVGREDDGVAWRAFAVDDHGLSAIYLVTQFRALLAGDERQVAMAPLSYTTG